MGIDVYEGISKNEITAKRRTSEGKPYSLDHAEELIVNMRYKGEGKFNANSQGWERSSTYYFKELQSKYPEIFSKKNTVRIENGESPRVDARFVKSFPQYKGYENEILIHHHVGKDGQAVALPQSMHKGSGEIHIYENELGITDNARKFSDKCKEICENNPRMVGQTSDKFKGLQNERSVQATSKGSENAISRAGAHEYKNTGEYQKTNAIKTISKRGGNHASVTAHTKSHDRK
jgi:hypothetical protein